MGHVLYDVLEINIVVTAVILLLCVFAGKLRKRYGARWMKLMWIVLVIRLLIPYNFSLPFAEVRFFSMPGFEQETVQSPENIGAEKQDVAQSVVNEESLSVENKPVSQIQQGMTLEVSGTTGATQELDVKSQQEGKAEPQQETQIETPIQSEELIGVEVAPKQELNTTVGTKSEQKGQNTNILLIVWLAGMILFVLYYISTYIGFQIKYKRSMKLLQDGALLEQINGLQEECLGKVHIDVYQSEKASSPMLVGLFAPKLVLSANIEDCQSKEFRMIVLHELCHYQQKDLWLKLLVLCAHCLNWFNPALYFMKKQCFYDIELVCDMTVLEDCDFEERELYARTMLSFAKSQKQNVSFSTNFSVSKKDLKNRISNMFDVSTKKSGLVAFLLVGVLILGMGLFVSCGYKPEEVESLESQEKGGETETSVHGENTANGQESTEISNTFDYNNPYNRMICGYEGNTYLGKNDGIYLLKDNEEICLFQNDYGLFRDVTLYENKLYFCGTVMRGEQLQNTIYYMDLSTLEVKDALALFSNNFNVLYDIAIYENQLYVLDENAKKIGFMLDESGMIVKQLDSEETDYLYKEYNEYISMQIDRWNTQYGSAEWKELTKKMSDRYVPVIDVAECMELLEGKHIVCKYKDELYQSIYLVNEANEYIYLCDKVNSGEVLITTDGLYYANNESRDFSYVDFETGRTKDIYAMEEAGEVFLVNYDAKYVYFGKSIWLNDDTTTTKELLMRIPREGGTPEVVYSFEEGFTVNSLYMYSAIDENFMYFMNHEKVSLGRKDNLTGVFGEVSAPAKDEVLAMRVKALEGMSEQEIERLKENIKVANQQMEKAYLYDDLFGKLSDPEHLYWNYFDQKADIQIGWEPDGTAIMVYNRFDADNFVALMEEMRDSLQSDLLKQDFNKLIECTKLAKETHEVEYAEQIYRILHDMDYFLLRYGIEDVGIYLDDLSTVAKYYGALEIYEKADETEISPDKGLGVGGTGSLAMQRVLPEEVAVSPAIVEYTLDEAMKIGDVLEFEGELPGTGIGILYTITIDGVEHFYGKYDFYGTEMKDYYGYAIFSEDYVLANGIKVGMSEAEILEMYPNMRIEDFEGNCFSDSEYKDAIWWNGIAYPTSKLGTDPNFEYNGKDYVWLDQFDYVMMADIDLGTYDTLPICLGLLMKDEKVKAITFYYPTAG